MMQLKAIFSVLLQGWEFEAAQPLDSYRNDHSKMVVQLRAAVPRALPPSPGEPPGEDRRRPRPVPGSRRLRGRGARGLLGLEEGRAHRAPARAAGELARRRRAGREVLPHPCPVHRGGLTMPAYPRAELEEMVERWLEVNRAGEAKKDWQHMAELYTEDATYGWNVGPQRRVHGRGPRADPRDRPRPGDGRPGGLDLPVPEGADRRAAGRGARPVEAGGRRQEGGRHATTRSPVWVAAGSATPGTSSGPGSATSSTSATPARPSWR